MNLYYKLKIFYNNLSNRTLGIIILLLIFFVGYFFYWYLFSYNLKDVKIISNVGNYKVKLKSIKYAKIYSFDCPKKECILKNISPFDYKLEILKDNYQKFSIEFNPKSKKILKINLQREVFLRPIEKNGVQKKISREEKIELIKLKNKFFFYKKFGNSLIALRDLGNKLELFFNNKTIGILDKVSKNDIFLDKVINTKNYYFLKLGANNYLINTLFLELNKIDLNLDIIYIKKINDDFLLITTKLGSFLCNLKNKKITYFNTLYDFIVLDNGKYLGLLKDNIIQQKKNLGFGDISGDLLVVYDGKTKNTKLIKQLNIIVKKIYKENQSIILEDISGNKYELINYK